MNKFKAGANDALIFMRQFHRTGWPNEGFYNQLVDYEVKKGYKSKMPKPTYYTFPTITLS